MCIIGPALASFLNIPSDGLDLRRRRCFLVLGLLDLKGSGSPDLCHLSLLKELGVDLGFFLNARGSDRAFVED